MIFNDEPVITKNNVIILILVILQPIIWFLVFIYNPDMTIDNFLGCIALSLFFILLISVLLLSFDREINENTLLLTILLFISEPFIFYSAVKEEEGYVNYIFLFRNEYKPNVIKDCDSNLTEKE